MLSVSCERGHDVNAAVKTVILCTAGITALSGAERLWRALRHSRRAVAGLPVAMAGSPDTPDSGDRGLPIERAHTAEYSPDRETTPEDVADGDNTSPPSSPGLPSPASPACRVMFATTVSDVDDPRDAEAWRVFELFVGYMREAAVSAASRMGFASDVAAALASAAPAAHLIVRAGVPFELPTSELEDKFNALEASGAPRRALRRLRVFRRGSFGARVAVALGVSPRRSPAAGAGAGHPRTFPGPSPSAGPSGADPEWVRVYGMRLALRAEVAALLHHTCNQRLRCALADRVSLRLPRALEPFMEDGGEVINAWQAAMQQAAHVLRGQGTAAEGYGSGLASTAKELCAEVRRRRVTYARELFVYLCAGSPFKAACIVVSFGILAVSSRLSAAGNTLRRRIEDTMVGSLRKVEGVEPPAATGTAPAHPLPPPPTPMDASAPCHRRGVGAARQAASRITSVSQEAANIVHDAAQRHASILVLIGFEVLRLAASTIVATAQSKFAAASTARHRDETKQLLYAALARAPLAFYDRHTYEEIEEMVFFVNDLEGVDVHAQGYLARLAGSAVDCHVKVAALLARPHGGPIVALLVAAVAGTSVMQWGLQKAARALARLNAEDSAADDGFEDTEELENAPCAAGGCLLRGLSILEHVHALRPFGADAALMDAWQHHVGTAVDARDGVQGDRSTVRGSWVRTADTIVSRLLGGTIRASVAWAPAAAKSVERTMQLLLPLVATALVQSLGTGAYASPIFVREVTASIEHLIATVQEARSVLQLLGRNAHKAHTVRELLALAAECSGSDRSAPGGAEASAAAAQVVRLEVRGLTFAYPSRPDRPVIRDASLSVDLAPGKLVVLTGPNGCGKSTLLQLLLRMYDPLPPAAGAPDSLTVLCRGRAGLVEGSLGRLRNIVAACMGERFPTDGSSERLTAVPLAAMRPAAARRCFAYVPQIAPILAGTVVQNITLLPRVSLGDVQVLERARAAAADAQCLDFIDALPEGMFTRIVGGTGGAGSPSSSGGACVRLSGGQAQRIAIARAFFHSAPVLLMDEPSSALDAGARERLIASLRSLILRNASGRPGSNLVRTVLCVSHDPDLIAAADVVVRMPHSQ